MLINLAPKARDWQPLSEEEQKKIAAGFQALNQVPGVTTAPGRIPTENHDAQLLS